MLLVNRQPSLQKWGTEDGFSPAVLIILCYLATYIPWVDSASVVGFSLCDWCFVVVILLRIERERDVGGLVPFYPHSPTVPEAEVGESKKYANTYM